MARKSLVEEIKIVDRYAALTGPYFKVLNERLASKNKREQEWAVEQLTKAYTRMIPQKIGGDPDNRIPIPLLYELHKEQK